MDFTVVGNLNSYMKAMEQRTTFQLKQQNGQLGSHTLTLDDMLTAARTEKDESESTNDTKLTAIQQKVNSGASLSIEEKAYLSQKDPLTYTKLCAIEMEQRSYEQELKQCKTREDAQRLRISHLGASLGSVKQIENNSAIPDEKKLQLIGLENRRAQALEETSQKFLDSGDYEKLPTEVEQSKAVAEEKRAETPETEKPEKIEKPEPKTEKASENTEIISQNMKPEKKSEPESEELKKVKRARAEAAYTAAFAPSPEPGSTIDANA